MTSHKDSLDERIDEIETRSLKLFDGTDISIFEIGSSRRKMFKELVYSEAYRIGMEAIGEDDPISVDDYSSVTALEAALSRNELRPKQRQRLSELTGQSNE